MYLLLCISALLASTHGIMDVFHVQSPDGRYRVASEAEAQTLCERYGASLATRDQLEGAYFRGLSVCNCGYVKGGTVTFPQRIADKHCGYSAGLQYCPKDYKDWGNEGWDAFCARDKEVTCPHHQVMTNQVANFTHYTEGRAVLFPELSFHTSGKIAQWSFYSIRPDVKIYASVWRHIGFSRYQLVGRNVLPTGRSGFVNYVVDEDDRIAVSREDFMGLHYETYMPVHPTVYSSIPFAKAPDHLCSTGGVCLKESDLYRALVVHRHEEQLNHKANLVVDLDKEVDKSRVEYLSPALTPTLCPEETDDPDEKPCHFPYMFKNKTRETCIEDWAKRAWCATTDVYDGNNWRFCRDGDLFPEEAPCHFPFEYKGTNVTKCISDNAVKSWCSLIPGYNYRQDWRYCRDVNATLLEDVRVTTVQDALHQCETRGLLLAMERDAQAVYDMGRRVCQCGWISNGLAVRVLRAGSHDCGDDVASGVHVCPDADGGYPPLCMEA